MIVRLHKLARTTPAIRAEIAASNESIQTLADRYGVSPMTVLSSGLDAACAATG